MTMHAKRLRSAAMLAAIGAALGVPAAGLADPSVGVWSGDAAAPVPHIPGPFAGSGTNDDPSAGQFTVTFDSTGRLVQIGRVSEPGALDVSPTVERRQSPVDNGSIASAASESTFASLRAQLRKLAREAPTAQTAQR